MDPSLHGSFQPASPVDLARWKGNWQNLNEGRNPAPGEDWGTAQISGLFILLGDNEGPFVDFSVWRPDGDEWAEDLSFDGLSSRSDSAAWTTKRFKGPAHFKAWNGGARVWANVMTALHAATPTACSLYILKIEQLDRDNPTWWWVVALADHKMRKKVWPELQGKWLLANGTVAAPGWCHDSHVWEAVIRESVFEMDSFWYKEVDKVIIDVSSGRKKKADFTTPKYGDASVEPPSRAAAVASSTGDDQVAKLLEQNNQLIKQMAGLVKQAGKGNGKQTKGTGVQMVTGGAGAAPKAAAKKRTGKPPEGVCRFWWRNGSCKLGDQCTWLHRE